MGEATRYCNEWPTHKSHDKLIQHVDDMDEVNLCDMK